MTEQIIFKLGSRCPNDAALTAGFEFAKGAGVPVRAYFLEDETLIKASRYHFSNEVRMFGATRGLELHELRRETRSALRAMSREVQRRSQAMQIETEFEALNGDGPQRIRDASAQENVFILGENQTARQLVRDYKQLTEIGGLRGILMAGPKARNAKGPVAVVVDCMDAWQRGLPLLKGFLLNAPSLTIFCIGDFLSQGEALVDDIEDDITGPVTVQGLRRFDQSRLAWEIERTGSGLLFSMPSCPLITGEKKLEALLRSLSCPLFMAL